MLTESHTWIVRINVDVGRCKSINYINRPKNSSMKADCFVLKFYPAIDFLHRINILKVQIYVKSIAVIAKNRGTFHFVHFLVLLYWRSGTIKIHRFSKIFIFYQIRFIRSYSARRFWWLLLHLSYMKIKLIFYMFLYLFMIIFVTLFFSNFRSPLNCFF